MIIFDSTLQLMAYIDQEKAKGKRIGFVPTMGALHQGHIELMKKSLRNSDITVCSIFVNPTQFNDPADLAKYPRTLELDSQMLKEAGVHVLFAPTKEQIYPDGMIPDKKIDLGGLDIPMEGVFRIGHFDGVAQVVKRLLEIVKPDTLYMGQKDFQQFSIINFMINQLKLPVKLIICPTKREKNGLAMSSRNQRLSPEMKEKASLIYKTLMAVKKHRKSKTISELVSYASKRLNTSDFKLEYFSIVDAQTLKDVQTLNESNMIYACTAVWAEGVRLIDNIRIK